MKTHKIQIPVESNIEITVPAIGHDTLKAFNTPQINFLSTFMLKKGKKCLHTKIENKGNSRKRGEDLELSPSQFRFLNLEEDDLIEISLSNRVPATKLVVEQTNHNSTRRALTSLIEGVELNSGDMFVFEGIPFTVVECSPSASYYTDTTPIDRKKSTIQSTPSTVNKLGQKMELDSQLTQL